MIKLPRHKARAGALQILYQLDMNRGLLPETAVFNFQRHFLDKSEEMDSFTQILVSGVAQNLEQIDKLIASCADNWRTDRMTVVDRNIIRVGTYELQHCQDIPATVTINEAVELAKEFGAESSPSFVNGVLDKIKSQVDLTGKAP